MKKVRLVRAIRKGKVTPKRDEQKSISANLEVDEP